MHLRLLIACLVLMLLPSIIAAQIPNAGFENWTNGEPDGWFTNNIQGVAVTCTQVGGAHGGSYAAQGTVVSAFSTIFAASYITGTVDYPGFPVNQRYEALHGFYKFTPAGGSNDMMSVQYLARKAGTDNGVGIYLDGTAQSTYKEFVAPINYVNSDVPDTGIIHIWMIGSGSLAHVGSTYLVDDLAFGPATGVHDRAPGEPAGYRLAQNYPNPFNPTTGIVYDIPVASHVTLTIRDVLGRTVAVLVNEDQPVGRYKAIFDGTGSSSGVYFYTIHAGRWSSTGTMMLSK